MKARDIVEEVRKDRKSGATALAERALEALSLSKSVASALIEARPGMPLIAAVVRLAKKKGVAAARREMKAGMDRLLERIEDVLPPGGRYVTFGHSGTVEVILRAVGARDPGKARPDVALVGADALLPDGDFVNAKGTAAFLRGVREQRAGVFVVATELKRISKAPPLEPGFEIVPGRLVHAILTDTGLHYPPMGTLAGVEPTWLDRGALNPMGGRGLCHPHHGR
jgi:translation initiation factor 2B subunit (eIF-2B alpha/beta/delta family)